MRFRLTILGLLAAIVPLASCARSDPFVGTWDATGANSNRFKELVFTTGSVRVSNAGELETWNFKQINDHEGIATASLGVSVTFLLSGDTVRMVYGTDSKDWQWKKTSDATG